MDYYSGTRKDLLPFVTTWMDFEHYAESDTKDKHCGVTYMSI